MKTNNTNSKPLLHTLFKFLENENKLGHLNSMSKSKQLALQRLINKNLNAYSKKLLTKWLKKTNTSLKRFYNRYLKSGYIDNNKGISIYKIKQISPVLIKEYKQRNLESVNLITTQSPATIEKIKQRMWNWIYEKGDTNKLSSTSLRESVKASNLIAKQDKHFSFILNDQMHKMRGNLDAIIAKELNAIAFVWRTRQDRRVVGNPSGFYPHPSNPKMHGNHFERKDKLYFYHNTWAIKQGLIDTKAKGFMWADFEDGMPSVPIGCRCYANNIYALNMLPDKFLTDKGKEYIKDNAIV